jgi:hypothetical protein
VFGQIRLPVKNLYCPEVLKTNSFYRLPLRIIPSHPVIFKLSQFTMYVKRHSFLLGSARSGRTGAGRAAQNPGSGKVLPHCRISPLWQKTCLGPNPAHLKTAGPHKDQRFRNRVWRAAGYRSVSFSTAYSKRVLNRLISSAFRSRNSRNSPVAFV